jgi:hypothetical protein
MWRHPLGEVSGGTDATTGARVQVMALNPGTVVTDAQLEAARSATRVASGVQCAAVVKPIDVQRLPDGRIAIATEALEGTPLTNISRNQPLPVNRTVAVLRQLCKALAAVHEVGLVHRALTLGSLVLRARTDKPDTVAVTDFGIGPLLEGDIVVAKEDASLQPVSPERISGVQQDEREDQYLMGCIAYSLLTGGAPFRTGMPDAVRRRHAIEDPMPIADRLKGTRGVHPALATWVHRCLAKEPDDRFEDILQCEASLCLAQIEAHIQTPWDDLPAPDVDATTAARITAGMRRGAAAAPGRTAEPEDELTVLRRPSDPSPEGQTTIVRNIDAEPVEIPDDVGSVPIRLGASDRDDTVVTHADDTVAGSLPQANEETAIGRAEEASPPEDDQREQTRRAAIPTEETAVGPATRDDTVTTAAPAPTRPRAPAPAPARAAAPTPVEPLDFGDPFADDDAGDRTQISSAPSLPFTPASVIEDVFEPDPEPADRTSVAPAALVTFTPTVTPGLPARAPSSTPTVPASAAIDPRLLPSSTTTLPGGGAPRAAAPPVDDDDDGDPFAEAPTIPPPMPAPIAPPVVAAPVVAAPVVAAPVVAAPVVAEPVVAAPVVAEPVIAAPVEAEPVVEAPPVVVAPAPVQVEPVVTAPPAAPAPPAPAPPVQVAPAFTPPLPTSPAVLPAHVAPPQIAPPWPQGPTGLTGQYTSANASFSASDMDASMIASIGGGNRTLKLALIVLAVASVVGGGFYLLMRPTEPPPPPPVVAAEPPAPVKVEKVTPPVDDIAADVAATPNDLVAAGDRAAGEGRAADAEALYQRAIVREPKHLGALLGLGRMQLGAGDVEKAAGYFRRAVGANPNDGAARIALGDALVKQGNVTEAKKQYRKAKSLKHPDAAVRLAEL